MQNPLRPTLQVESIYDIDLAALRSAGIRLLLLDLDNTLIAYGTEEPDAALLQWLDEVRRTGLHPFILSNSRKSTRVPNIAAKLSLPYIKWAGKPKSGGFLRAMAQVGADPGETAMVGDQIFTDIWGARRLGLYAILVKPIAMDTVFRRLRFAIEQPLRRL